MSQNDSLLASIVRPLAALIALAGWLAPLAAPAQSLVPPELSPAGYAGPPYSPAGDSGPALAARWTPPVAASSSLPTNVSDFQATDANLSGVLQRLHQAEETIAALQSRMSATEPPAEEDRGVFGLLGDRWRSAGDPEVELVNYSTYSSYAPDAKPKKWYEKYTFRGYAQFRINESMCEEPGSAPPQHAGDRSVQDNQNFLIRRARLIWAADISEHMYVYLQPDFAVTPPGSPDATYFAQVRDWYGDLYIDHEKIHRLRVGQSKVPYGWENLQSSSNRVPLDRSDSFNSAVRNERDLGIFYYWTPIGAQDFFKEVLDMGLKGSGNYGVFGFGFYNGQGGSLLEQNENLHTVIRFTLPVTFDNCQHMEIGVQAYTGLYTVLGSAISPQGVGPDATPAGTLTTGGQQGIRDERIGGSFIWYPQPIGFQCEWNVGRGPGLNDAQTEVVERPLYGGYVMVLAKIDGYDESIFYPFARWNYYKGGYKPERNAPFSEISELECGVEWQIHPQAELTLCYTVTDRTNTNAISADDALSYGQYDGQIARCQLQINY